MMVPVTNLSLVLGRRRMGKTTLCIALGISRHDTVIHWDVNDQAQGFPQTTSDPRQLQRWLEEPQTPGSGNIIIVKPKRGQLKQQFAEICEIVFPWEDIALICDEASEMQGPHSIDESLEHLVRRWNDESTLIQATHRLRDTNAIVRQNVTDLYLFTTAYEPDLAIIESHYSEEIAQAVKTCKIHECVHAWPELGGAWRYCKWVDPSVWYVPLDRTKL